MGRWPCLACRPSACTATVATACTAMRRARVGRRSGWSPAAPAAMRPERLASTRLPPPGTSSVAPRCACRGWSRARRSSARRLRDRRTAEVLHEARVAAGIGCVVLDGEGGRGLPSTALALAARYRVRSRCGRGSSTASSELDCFSTGVGPYRRRRAAQRAVLCGVAANGLLAADQLLAAHRLGSGWHPRRGRGAQAHYLGARGKPVTGRLSHLSGLSPACPTGTRRGRASREDA